jgi:16S rRNA (guanine(966)-N(2))-methyltransferase RsmD
MRIIAGRYRSRLLDAPAGLKTRPTSDRLRETLFNVLAPRIEGAAFLDLYAGSGAVGIEALSRGAARVVFVERADSAVRALRANLAKLEVQEGFRIAPAGVSSYLRNVVGAAFDIVYLDPPYDAEDEYAGTLGLLGREVARLLRPDAIVVAEHRRKQTLNDAYGAMKRTRLLEQGDAALSFYALGEDAGVK